VSALTEGVSVRGSIMVVDDNPANLKLLEDMLQQCGYEVRSFPRGRLALASVDQQPPDLILLDINMPEMNGYEVCERLQSVEKTASLPVIFLSAQNETEDKVRAFRSGAVDYIAKPFQFEEVHARVKTHLKLHALQRALELQNEQLEKTVAARTRELAEANERLIILDRSKNDFLKLISHEFRTPLIGLLGVSELVLEGMPVIGQTKELEELFVRSRRRILSILDDALLLTQIDVEGEQFRSAPVSLSVVLREAIESASEVGEPHDVTLTQPPLGLEFAVGDRQLLVRALTALLETAVKFSARGETVHILCEAKSDWLTVMMETRGATIPGSALAKFFDLFSIAETIAPGADLGVGPALASRILSLFGGSVRVANRNASGIRLTILLKRARTNCNEICALSSTVQSQMPV
jgi:two-component system, sensor histidine kinase and response regulator